MVSSFAMTYKYANINNQMTFQGQRQAKICAVLAPHTHNCVAPSQ